MDVINLLQGTVKHYDWGGYNFIPSLLRLDNPENKPYAEYWMGAHPLAECRVVGEDGSTRLLRDFFSTMSPTALGEYVTARFGNLPYLLKVLDVKGMLSIQVHPGKSDAERDFAAENERGIALDSPARNYKDDNHKPELLVAISEFWLLHGFKPEKELKQTLQAVPELKHLLPIFEKEGYRGLYKTVMVMPQSEVDTRLQPLLDRIVPLYKEGRLDRSSADFWAARAAIEYSKQGHTDRGIFSIYLFNLMALRKGEAIFQDAGVPHAYLEGQNVEIMANSDNVLRGGLTSKHIDVPELLKHVKCEPTRPNIIKGDRAGAEYIYRTTAQDFELSSYKLHVGDQTSFIPSTAEILLLIDGEVVVSHGDREIILRSGQPSAIIFPGKEINIRANQPSWLFKSTVPMPGVDKSA